MPAVSAPLQPGSLIGPYRLVKLISRGRMGEVWRASKGGEAGWRKDVAVKVMPDPGGDHERFVQQFEREARVAALLDHPNVVGTFHFGREGTLLWIEQELVEGHDLRRIVDACRDGAPPALALFIVGEVLKALQYALERRGEDGAPLGMIHRDIKPSNVLCAREGHVKLADFGLAKLMSEGSATLLGQRRAIPQLAPEQIDGQRASPASDVFAVGLVLWELLTGSRLFDGASEAERLQRTLACLVPPLVNIRPEVPQAIELLVRRMLARNVVDRFPNAGEALEAVLTTPVGARPATSFDLRRFLETLPPGPASSSPSPSSSPADDATDETIVAEQSSSSLPPPMGDSPAAMGPPAWPSLPSLIVSPSDRAPWDAPPTVAPPPHHDAGGDPTSLPTVIMDAPSTGSWPSRAPWPPPAGSTPPPGAPPHEPSVILSPHIDKARTPAPQMLPSALPSALLRPPPPIGSPPVLTSPSASQPLTARAPVAPLVAPDGGGDRPGFPLPVRPRLGIRSHGPPAAPVPFAPAGDELDDSGLPPPDNAGHRRRRLMVAGAGAAVALALLVILAVALAGPEQSAPPWILAAAGEQTAGERRQQAPREQAPRERAPREQAPREQASPAEAAAPEKDAPPPPPGSAVLEIHVKPVEARVLVDGRQQPGREPFRVSDIDTRWPVHVRVELAGYRTWEEQVIVQPPGRELTIELERAQGEGGDGPR